MLLVGIGQVIIASIIIFLIVIILAVVLAVSRYGDVRVGGMDAWADCSTVLWQ